MTKSEYYHDKRKEELEQRKFYNLDNIYKNKC